MPLLAINHHYFRTKAPGSGIYPTTPEQLTGEVQAIRAHGWRIGTEDDIRSFIRGELSDDDAVCILTFDDGLREQMQAIALLDRLGASAICYAPTAPLTGQFVLDVHKLHLIRATVDDARLADSLDAQFGFHDRSFDESALATQYRYDGPLSRRVKYFLNFLMSDEDRRKWISSIFEELFGCEAACAESLYLRNDELISLADKGLLGSHAHNHLPLATLSPGRITEELSTSREILAEITGTAPSGISYPFGGKSAIGDAVFREAEAAGYIYGFTMERGINTDPRDSSPLALKRIDVNDIEAWL